jgi:hypothetical protein
MTLHFRRRPSPATCIAVAALVVATAGVTYAAIPAADGTIHGCYTNMRGTLRVVDDGVACESLETALTWSQTGPHGATGAPGPTGAMGAAGPQGPAGAAGPAGVVRAYTSKKDSVKVGRPPEAPIGNVVDSLSVPFGVYMVVAKARIVSFGQEGIPSPHRVDCTLSAGASFDEVAAQQRVIEPLDNRFTEHIALTLVTRFSSGSARAKRAIQLRCVDFGPATDAFLRDIKIIAIPVVGETTG